MIEADLDKLCPQIRHAKIREKCLTALQNNLDNQWRKTSILAKEAGVKLGEITRILMFLQREGIVERKRERFTYWRVAITVNETVELQCD